MGEDNKKTREDEMWCPECGAPIKKGFFTCSNCRIKVKMTREINRQKDKRPSSGSKVKPKEKIKKEQIPVKSEVIPIKRVNDAGKGKNPLKKSGHPRYWNF